MCRDNIYLIPYLYPDSWRSTVELYRSCSGSSHKQSRCCKGDRRVQCQRDSGDNEGVWGPGEAAARKH